MIKRLVFLLVVALMEYTYKKKKIPSMCQAEGTNKPPKSLHGENIIPPIKALILWLRFYLSNVNFQTTASLILVIANTRATDGTSWRRSKFHF